MGRFSWPLGVALAFALGLAAGELARGVVARSPDAERLQAVVDRQELQIQALEARIRSDQSRMLGRASVGGGRWEDARPASVTMVDPAQRSGRRGRGGSPQGESQDDLTPPARRPRAAVASSAATVDTALQRIQKFFDGTSGLAGGARWQQQRELLNDLRGMGEPAVDALMRMLASAQTSDERRVAAQLLGDLQAARAVPVLQGILDQDSDVLLRRAAASALRRLDSPDTVPIMQTLLSDPGEDRFVRLSAAFGLAQLGSPQGVAGLTMIFDEANADGRGRDGAFRAMLSLNDDRAVPFMRQVASSQAEPNLRVQAINFLATQGDKQALPALQQIMQTPTEQPSIKDAATQAFASISSR